MSIELNSYVYSMETVSEQVQKLDSVKNLVNAFNAQLQLVHEAEAAESNIAAARANFEHSNTPENRKKLDDTISLAGTLNVRREDLRKKVTEANTEIAKCMYSYMLKGDSPVYDALKLGKIPAYRVVNGSDGSDVEYTPAWVDIAKMQSYAKCNIGNKSGWQHSVEILARDMLAQAKGDILSGESSKKKIPASFYDLPDYDLGTEAEKHEKKVGRKKIPGSTRDIVNRLQEVVDEIVFVSSESNPDLNSIKVLNKDAKFFERACIRDNGDLSLVGKRGGTMRNLVYRIIYRIVNNLEFSVVYSTSKK